MGEVLGVLDEQFQTRNVFFVGDVTETSFKTAVERIFTLAEQDSTKPIHFIIDSFGGEVDEALAIHDAIRIIGTPVHTVGLGKIMSAGCLILASGARDHRTMAKHSRLMYHEGKEFHHGNVWEQKRFIAEFERQEKDFDRVVAELTGRTFEEVVALYKTGDGTRIQGVDKYMTATQAKSFGFVDEVI